VLRSPIDNAWLSGLNLTLDWYKVEIEDAILQYSLDFAQFRCFGQTVVTNARQKRQHRRLPPVAS
jgi:hypothetical protein